MEQRRKLTTVGILMLLGAGLSGCGILNGLGIGSSHTPSTNTISSNIKTGLTATSTNKTKGKHKPAVVYPSFGLDVSDPEALALNERLAELGYLPVQVNAAKLPVITASNISAPPRVSFKWRYSNIPSSMADLWSDETYTEMTRAAVISVEHVNGLPIDGIVGPSVWKAILAPNAKRDPNPYTYVLVTKNPAPEELRLWENGKWVYHSVANTGVHGATSTDGTFAVYERLVSQTMRGKNPDGTKYDDPGVPYVNYYDGSQAIHGFPRPSYGFPQSVGCVELPIPHAKEVWGLIHYGTLVTVEGHYVPPVVSDGSTDESGSGASGGSAGKSGNGSSDGSAGGASSSGSGGHSKPPQNTTGGGTGSNTSGGSGQGGKGTGNTTGAGAGTGSNSTPPSSGGSGTGNTAGAGAGTGSNTTTGNGTGAGGGTGNTAAE